MATFKGDWDKVAKEQWDSSVRKVAEATIPYRIKKVIVKLIEIDRPGGEIEEHYYFIIKFKIPKNSPKEYDRRANYVFTEYGGLVKVFPRMKGFKKWATQHIKSVEDTKVYRKKYTGFKPLKDLTKHNLLDIASYMLQKKEYSSKEIKAELKDISASTRRLAALKTAYKKMSDQDKLAIHKKYKWKTK